MITKVIEKKSVNDLLNEVVKDWDTYVPQRVFDDDVLFEKLPRENGALGNALERIALGDEDTLISPKEIFFPQLETMFAFKRGRHIIETVESSPKLLLGIKPCDFKGVLFMDDFFKRNFKDKYYLSRIQERFIIVIGCLKPPRPSACFCTSAKTGPFLDEGYDLQFVDSGDSYWVEIGSEKGREFLGKYAKFFEGSTGDTNNPIKQIRSKAADSMAIKVDFQKALQLMETPGFIPQENYKRIAERCIYCGACIYTCPTCTCFNVFDQMEDQEGSRCRNWDACVFEGYMRETGGHNPRRDKWLRTARRYEHKLRDDYRVTGTSGCMGCGRCLSSCPVNIGMAGFIQEITEERSIM